MRLGLGRPAGTDASRFEYASPRNKFVAFAAAPEARSFVGALEYFFFGRRKKSAESSPPGSGETPPLPNPPVNPPPPRGRHAPTTVALARRKRVSLFEFMSCLRMLPALRDVQSLVAFCSCNFFEKISVGSDWFSLSGAPGGPIDTCTCRHCTRQARRAPPRASLRLPVSTTSSAEHWHGAQLSDSDALCDVPGPHWHKSNETMHNRVPRYLHLRPRWFAWLARSPAWTSCVPVALLRTSKLKGSGYVNLPLIYH